MVVVRLKTIHLLIRFLNHYCRSLINWEGILPNAASRVGFPILNSHPVVRCPHQQAQGSGPVSALLLTLNLKTIQNHLKEIRLKENISSHLHPE